MKKKLTKSSGNIFVDLGFDPAEVTVLQMQANLMSDLGLYIEMHKLTQSDAAKRLGIAQSRVSDLVRGKWDKLSLEMLITLEARIRRTIRVRIRGIMFPRTCIRHQDASMQQGESQVPSQPTTLRHSADSV